MTSPGDDVIAQFDLLPAQEQKKVAAKAVESTGLFDLDRTTRRIIWILVFAVLAAIAVIAMIVIWHSWTVDVTTTSGTGATATKTTSHPDVAAAWAVVSAVVAGIVGLLVPSPTSGGNKT